MNRDKSLCLKCDKYTSGGWDSFGCALSNSGVPTNCPYLLEYTTFTENDEKFYDELQEIEKKMLNRLEKFFDEELEDAYYVHGSLVEKTCCDTSENFSFEGAKQQLEEVGLLKQWEDDKNDYEEIEVLYWEGDEDSVSICEKTGKYLNTSLTEYGVEQELDHFEEHYKEPKDFEDIGDGELYCLYRCVIHVTHNRGSDLMTTKRIYELIEKLVESGLFKEKENA